MTLLWSKANESILAFERRGDGERILCLFNFSNRKVAAPVSQVLGSPIEGHGFGNATPEQNAVLLPPFGAWFGIPAES